VVHREAVTAVPGETRLDAKLPTATVAAVWGSAEEAERDVRERAVLSRLAEGRITAGMAAVILGTASRDLLDLLVRRRVLGPDDAEDLRKDVGMSRAAG
jgi:predicted HTH domain antitoxin